MINKDDHVELYGCGNLLAITTNQDLNRIVCQRWAELLDGKGLFRWEKMSAETEGDRQLSGQFMSGEAIWRDLPLSRWMQADCDSPPIFLRQIDADEVNKGAEDDESRAGQQTLRGGHALLTLSNDATLKVGAPASYGAGDHLLVIDTRGSQRGCPLPLVPTNVTQSTQTELYGLYEEMLIHLQSQSYNVDPQTTLADIWKREEAHTSLLGHGVSLPHYWSPDLQRSVLMVSRPDASVVCPTTGEPIKLVFLLLSPNGDPKTHLEHLSCIARLIGSESRRLQLLGARDTDELFELIVSSH